MEQREDMTPVIILTKHFRIRGDIGLMPGARFTDYMNEAREFIAVSGAEVSDHNGKTILSGGFLNVQRASIDIAMPADQEIDL